MREGGVKGERENKRQIQARERKEKRVEKNRRVNQLDRQAGSESERESKMCWVLWAHVVIDVLLSLVQTSPQRLVE